MQVRKVLQLAMGRVRAIGRGRKSKAIILMYHSFSNELMQPNWLVVSPENFARYLAHIRRTYQPIRLVDLVESIMNGVIPDRAVTVTTDDGYRNNFTEALPLLNHAQIPATVFVTAGFIESSREIWWDELPVFF